METVKVWLFGAFATGVALPLAFKYLKAFLMKNFGELLSKTLTLEQVQDTVLQEKLKKVSTAVCELVEYIVPDRGDGPLGMEKFAHADKIMQGIPLIGGNAAIRKALIEDGCELMWAADEKLKAEMAEHCVKVVQKPFDGNL